ncbi:MAG: 2-dehydropantoate 2-reductase [Intrasporangiaceae bacterium]|nr:2-dehydropantoate 2-reductase [Intrasporangiaceae bacterium]
MTASHPPIGTVAVVGAGAMGAMYADHFSRAGFHTQLIAGGGRAARLRARPIAVNDRVLDAEVVDPLDPSAAHKNADLVLVAVKHAQLPEAAELIAPLVGRDTTILSVLNGLESEEILLRGLRERRPDTTPDQVPLCIALAMDAERSGHRAIGSATPRPAGSSSDRRRRRASRRAAAPGSRPSRTPSPAPGSPGPHPTTCATRCGGSSWSTSASTSPRPCSAHRTAPSRSQPPHTRS